jgi:F-type H+-transporting ATPase subunit gamma
MEDLSRIKARLESLDELGELVRALRSMAASRAREAQGAFAGTQAYLAVIERAIGDVMLLSSKGPRDIAPSAATKSAIIVITSDNGFVGLFNSRMIERALELRTPCDDLVIVGRRGQSEASERDVRDAIGFSMASRVQDIAGLARRIMARLSGVNRVRIVFARHRPGTGFDPTVKEVLPYKPDLRDSDIAPPLVHLPADQLLERMAPEYLFAEISHTLMESLASENGIRMRAMDMASRNIDNRVSKLRHDADAARQEATTTEMLDVVTGAEAVEQG